MKSFSCIRVFADTRHIERCQRLLSSVAPDLRALAALSFSQDVAKLSCCAS